jgi:hypothetical protein
MFKQASLFEQTLFKQVAFAEVIVAAPSEWVAHPCALTDPIGLIALGVMLVAVLVLVAVEDGKEGRWVGKPIPSMYVH